MPPKKSTSQSNAAVSGAQNHTNQAPTNQTNHPQNQAQIPQNNQGQHKTTQQNNPPKKQTSYLKKIAFGFVVGLVTFGPLGAIAGAVIASTHHIYKNKPQTNDPSKFKSAVKKSAILALQACAAAIAIGLAITVPALGVPIIAAVVAKMSFDKFRENKAKKKNQPAPTTNPTTRAPVQQPKNVPTTVPSPSPTPLASKKRGLSR